MIDTTSEYTELEKAVPQELLEAVICACKDNPGAGQWIRLGFNLAQPDGWKHVAPYWFKMWREV